MSSLLAWPAAQPLTPRARPIAEAVAGPGRHILALDGIRGLAVLLVLVFHIFQVEPAPQQTWLRLGYAATRFGQTGVDLFFVLSGFLITGILFDSKTSPRYFLNFYGRRTLRIFPLYYGVLIVLLVIVPAVFGLRVTGLSPVSLWTFSANFAMAAGGDGGMLGHFWSLAIEEQFYLAWPMVVYALGRAALMRVCLVSLVAAAGVRVLVESQGVSSFMVTPCRVDTLLLGALLALAARSPLGLIDWSRQAVAIALAALALGLPLCGTMRGSGSVWLQVVKYPLIATLYGAVLVLGVTAPRTSRIGRFFNHGALRNLGKYSFGLYVYHPPLIQGVHWIFRAAPGAAPLTEAHPAMALAVKVVMIAAGSYGLAWLSWHLYEKRFLALKRYFEYS